nr:hypothetical protein [uncultured Enterobacter sp.]
MPNIQFSYTANLPAQDKLSAFATHIHTSLAPVVNTDVGNFRTFFIPVAGFVAGAGESQKAFLHIDFRMLPGRTPEVKKAAADLILTLAAEHLTVGNGVQTAITVEIGDIDKENYHKVILNG